MTEPIPPRSAPAVPAAPAAPSFDALPLPPALQAVLKQLDYRAMTPIQAASLPLALAGHDLIAQARTGSGKTAAFALTLLARLDLRRFAVQALVLCPTRELAEQVGQEIRRLARFEGNIKVLTLCGGSTMRPQLASLGHGAHVVVGTPGRIMDHLQRGSLVLDALETLVLDEADRMLDMGFHDDIAFVAGKCPARRQTLLFSATYPDGIDVLAHRFLREPQQVRLTEPHAGGTIRQRFYRVEPQARLQAVARLLRHYRPLSALAFCNTRQQCRDLVDVLRAQGFHALTLNGELEQRERDQVLVRFANRSCSVLVATDVAARGLDISQLEAVINVDMTPDPDLHLHRIGRTGRAEQDGWALSLCTPADQRRVAALAEAMGREPEWHELDALQDEEAPPPPPPMVTLQILGGRKDKIRPGDVLGALTGEAGCSREQVGKITVTDQTTYVAVARDIAPELLRRLAAGRLKGKPVKVRALEE
ncbi:ATP-dependent RNA helicase DbpA [Thauera chlorobenzoica]|uniref:ATP-dependent 23S rRNA helicase DbpA n=1 Tax=Thauera chlorobenzoica TaxID=96773 RepID=A0A1H5W1F4_9RHOO|nr:ATP-dependent RNA helicase DbpA [Thauera chlorobenzoica]APR03317.1 ATP-dependent 23S rRNA helicase DbpA [Thauera chlorobenzoica]SEF92971.1 ATP-dependent RNA helicase DbpA [Thauera chlorobenzoica]